MTQKIFLVFLMITIVAVAGEAFTGIIHEPVAINIDTTQSLGVIPEVLRPGLMGTRLDSFCPLRNEIVNLKKNPVWRLNFLIADDIPGFVSATKPNNFEEDFTLWLTQKVDPQLKQFQDAGYQLIISLAQIPKWLSLYPYDECLPQADGCFVKWAYSPPKDYVEWEKLLKLLVSIQISDGIKADYIIGDEPDWAFYGTEEQYLEFYRYSVKAIKEVDQNIKVGAPGVSHWGSGKYGNCPAEATGLADGECPPQNHTMIQALIDYVAQNNIALDFIDWHFPDKYTLRDEVQTTKKWLKDAGLQEAMPMTIGEWAFSPKGEMESTEKASAYAIHLLKAFMDNGIYRHSATSIYDQIGWESGDWAHVGFFSFEGIVRTKWNSLKALDKLSGNRIKADTTDEDRIVAISFKDNGKVSVLTSNFITPEEVALEAAIDSFSNQSNLFAQSCTQTIGVNVQAFYDLIKAYLMGQLSIDHIKNIFVTNCGSFPDYVENDFINSKQTAIQVYNGKLSYKPSPRGVELKITNIIPGTYTYRKYVIDGDMNEIHSNPCRYNKKTESSPSNTECGIDGELERAVIQAKNYAISATTNYLLSIGYQQLQIDKVRNCLATPNCNANDLIGNYCQAYPSKCTQLENDVHEAQQLFNNLFYHGTYTVTNGTTYTISAFIDQINNLKEVSLEGSKREEQVHISGGTYSENFSMEPYSVILIEILPVP